MPSDRAEGSPAVASRTFCVPMLRARSGHSLQNSTCLQRGQRCILVHPALRPVAAHRRCTTAQASARTTQKVAKKPGEQSMNDPEVHYLVKQVQSRLTAAVQAEEVRFLVQRLSAMHSTRRPCTMKLVTQFVVLHSLHRIQHGSRATTLHVLQYPTSRRTGSSSSECAPMRLSE